MADNTTPVFVAVDINQIIGKTREEILHYVREQYERQSVPLHPFWTK